MDFSAVSPIWLTVATLVCAVAGNNWKAYYIKKHIETESGYYLLNAGCLGVGFAVMFALCGGKLILSPFSAALAVAFGAVTAAAGILNAKAIKMGPYGYTTVIVSLSTAITALSGAIFWHETLTVLKIAGIALMVLCFFLAVDTHGGGKKANVTWFLLCVLTLLLTAGIGLMQKVHQTSAYKAELLPFLAVAFAVSALIPLVVYFPMRKRERRREQAGTGGRIAVLPFLLAALICGIGAAGNNALNLYLAGVLETAVFFPVVNGVPLLAGLLVSFLVFREKLKTKQLIGLAVGVGALVCLLF